MSEINGILLVDKPKGWTSFDVVAKVRGIIATEYRSKNLEPRIVTTEQHRQLPKRIKVGHTGTLDPSATGLLVLCIGKATKLVPTMIKHNKTYEVEMTLGSTSTTGDQEGVITPSSSTLRPEQEIVEATLRSFVGEQMQIPPAFSAIKVDGKRAYELARAGKEVKLEPRPCTIYELQFTAYNFPHVTFTCGVSSGTYIRSLVEDIGKKLSNGAYMSELRRTKVADYEIAHAISLDNASYAIVHNAAIDI